MKQTSQRSLMFRQNVNRTEEDRRRACPRQGGRGMRTRLRPRRRAVDRAAMRPYWDYVGKLALRRKVAGDVCVVCRHSLKMFGDGFSWVEYKHGFPKFAAECENRSCLIGVSGYQRKAVGVGVHGVDKGCDCKIYVRTLLFKLYDMSHPGMGFFHVCQRMQGASTFRLKPPRRIGRASRVEYNPLMGSVRIVPNSAAWRKEGARVAHDGVGICCAAARR